MDGISLFLITEAQVLSFLVLVSNPMNSALKGFSTYLNCNMSTMPTCIADLNKHWGNNLHYFSTTGAAYDVAYGMKTGLISFSVRLDSFYSAKNDFSYENSYLYGVSYGTFFLYTLMYGSSLTRLKEHIGATECFKWIPASAVIFLSVAFCKSHMDRRNDTRWNLSTNTV